MSARKYKFGPEADIEITAAYRRFREFNQKQAISGCARRLGIPRYALTQRARALGLARTKEIPWSHAEEELLDKLAHFSDMVIARKMKAAGFPRTATAINVKIKRLKLRQAIDGYSARKLGIALGIDCKKIRKWIDLGWLRVVMRGTLRTEAQGGDTYFINHEEVRRFVLAHPDEIDLAKVDPLWFIDLVSGGKMCEEFRKELAG